MRHMKKLLFALLTVMLCLIVLPAAVAEANGMIRVKLTALGTPSSVTMKTNCDYVYEGGMNIPSGSTVTVSLSNGALVLTCGDRSMNCGTSLSLLRCTGGNMGVRFTSPALSNTFCGDLRFTASAEGISVLLNIYVEHYLYGVVGYEMSNSYPKEALKAQAIAARTFAMMKKSTRTSSSYDVTDSTKDQVFKGYNPSQSNVITAVNETRGQVLTYKGGYASCYYTDSNGGQTESTKNAWGSSLAYSKVQDDPYDLANTSAKAKNAVINKDASNLNASLMDALLYGATQTLGSGAADVRIDRIASVVPAVPKYADPSRLYTQLIFYCDVSGKVGASRKSAACAVSVGTYGMLENWYGLSINSGANETVSVSESNDAFTVTFRRSGHGIGMSQRGAQNMASAHGMNCAQILSFYYPGTAVEIRALSESVTGRPVAEATATPEPTEIPELTEEPTVEPTATPESEGITPEPTLPLFVLTTATPTPEPTAVPTPEPVQTPSVEFVSDGDGEEDTFVAVDPDRADSADVGNPDDIDWSGLEDPDGADGDEWVSDPNLSIDDEEFGNTTDDPDGLFANNGEGNTFGGSSDAWGTGTTQDADDDDDQMGDIDWSGLEDPDGADGDEWVSDPNLSLDDEEFGSGSITDDPDGLFGNDKGTTDKSSSDDKNDSDPMSGIDWSQLEDPDGADGDDWVSDTDWDDDEFGGITDDPDGLLGSKGVSNAEKSAAKGDKSSAGGIDWSKVSDPDGADDDWDDEPSTAAGYSLEDALSGMKKPKKKTICYVNVSMTSTLAMRKAPSAEAKAVIWLHRGTKLTVLAYNKTWAYVQTAKGKKGFTAIRFLSLEPVSRYTYELETFRTKEIGVTVCTIKAETAKAATVYSYASNDSKQLGIIPKGTKLTVAAYNKTWAYVTMNDKAGFVHISRLKKR